MQKRPSLGRGLSALLGENLMPNQEYIGHDIVTLPLTLLKPGQYQPRSFFDDEKLVSLIDSVREQGILQPLIVRKIDDEKYEIIAGERRWRAAKSLNLVDVPVIVRECSDTQALELAIIENIQRDDLNPLEEADAYQKLILQFQYTQAQVAKRIGKSRSYVANMLRLTTLPPHVKKLIHEGVITAGHARALMTLENYDEVLKEIVDNNLNVREVEQKVRDLKEASQQGIEPKNTKKKPLDMSVEKNEDILSIEGQMRDIFQTNVEIQLKRNQGAIVIHFNSFDQMDDLVQMIGGLRTHDQDFEDA